MKKQKKRDNTGCPCPDCEQGTLEEVITSFKTINEEKKTYIVPGVEMEICSHCAQQFLTPEGSKHVSDYLAAASDALTRKELETFLKKYDLTQKKAAQILGIGEKNFSRWISGKQRVSSSMSNYIRTLISHPQAFETLRSRNWGCSEFVSCEDLQPSEEEKPILKDADTGKLIKLGLIPKTRKRNELRTELCQLAGVDNLIQFQDWCNTATDRIAAFKDTNQQYSAINGGLWIRLGEQAAKNINVSPYSRDKLENAVEDLRELTQHEPHEVFGEIQSRLARAGVAFVVIPKLQGSAFRGCTRLLNPAKAMIVHALKFQNTSQFWRVLFHEIAHLILHIETPEDRFDDYEDQKEDQFEKDADDWADELLVYGEKMIAFKARHPEPEIYHLLEFAKDLKTSPSVVAEIVNDTYGHKVYDYGYLRKKGLFPSIQKSDSESMWAVSRNHILNLEQC